MVVGPRRVSGDTCAEIEPLLVEHDVWLIVDPQQPETFMHGNVSWQFGVFTKDEAITLPPPTNLLIDPWIEETLAHFPQYAPTIDELEVAAYSMFTVFDMKLRPVIEPKPDPPTIFIAISFLYRVT
jgi:hypothetical protein